MSNQSILHDTAALRASRRLGITGLGLEKTIERLTTGLRINRAADDAAGLAISNNLGADIRIANQGRRNANDGISYLQVADGVLEEVNSLLTRALELTEQARTGTINDTNRQALNLEFQNILKGICDIGMHTKFNGQSVFVNDDIAVSVADFSMISIKTGEFADPDSKIQGMMLEDGTLNKQDENILIFVGNPNINGGEGIRHWSVGGDPLDKDSHENILDADNATRVRPWLYEAIQQISMMRASIGANQQQLTSVADSLGIQTENFTAAYSQIRDANIADEVINLSKYQILTQSGTSALSNANQAAQLVLQLLR
jgi:flagellin